MLAEIKRRLELIRRGETDISRWLQPANLLSNWDKRSPFAAALCAESKCVCDMGCGKQTLRSLLPKGIKYLPSDLAKRTEDTLLCNFNEKLLPVDYLLQADTVTLLGVIEYVYDVPWVLRSLKQYLGTLIVSYNPSDMAEVARREKGWVNDFRLVELTALIVDSGYVLRDVNLVDPGQVIIRATVEHPVSV